MSQTKNDITGSLEDYLETIYRILGTSSVARVRDIAEEMDVSPASVSPAMKRLVANNRSAPAAGAARWLTNRGARRSRCVSVPKLMIRYGLTHC